MRWPVRPPSSSVMPCPRPRCPSRIILGNIAPVPASVWSTRQKSEFLSTSTSWSQCVQYRYCRAAIASQTIITMLPSSPHVQSVFTDEHGILSAFRSLPPELAASTLCIDSTTLDVNVARAVAQRVNAAGARMVDAPVSGGREASLCISS